MWIPIHEKPVLRLRQCADKIKQKQQYVHENDSQGEYEYA